MRLRGRLRLSGRVTESHRHIATDFAGSAFSQIALTRPGSPISRHTEPTRRATYLPRMRAGGILHVEFVDPDEFRQLIERTFATDRDLVPKGIVEVVP